jgi:hypothetical protein
VDLIIVVVVVFIEMEEKKTDMLEKRKHVARESTCNNRGWRVI